MLVSRALSGPIAIGQSVIADFGFQALGFIGDVSELGFPESYNDEILPILRPRVKLML
jgi:hypothetical protein